MTNHEQTIQRLKQNLQNDNINPNDAILNTHIQHDELTIYVHKNHIRTITKYLRNDQNLRYELCLGVSGVHYTQQKGQELHACYHFLSITHKQQIRIETTCSEQNPTIPTIVDIYPANNWHERETWDLMGIIFEGHPSLTRTAMPDDWQGHPQRKDYPLGGVNIDYKGAQIPPIEKRGQND